MEWHDPLSCLLGENEESSEDSHFEESRLEARVDLKGKDDLVGEEGRCMRAAKRINAYFSERGYKRETIDLGGVMQDRFTRDGEVITQSHIPLPDQREFRSIKFVWNFDCTENSAQEHVESLRGIYKEMEFDSY